MTIDALASMRLRSVRSIVDRRPRRDRKLHPDLIAGVVLVLDLGFGERGLLHHRPHHRLRAAIERAVRARTSSARARSAPRRRSSWWCRDASQSPSTPSRLNSSRCTSIQCSAKARHSARNSIDRHRVLVLALGAVLLLDLPLDRQAVAVPARHVVGVVAEHLLAARHHVLEDLVERVPDMDVAVGVGRAVVQDEFRPAAARPRAAAGRGRAAAQRARSSGSFCGRPARIGKSVFGRNRVSL